VHAVRDGFAEIGFKKVMDLDLLGLTLGLPLGFCRNSGMRPSEAVWSADDQKASEQNWDAAVDAWAVGRSSCSFLIMCIVSMPARRMLAQRKDLNPSMGRTMRLIARWSCSTMLLRYFGTSTGAARCPHRSQRAFPRWPPCWRRSCRW